MSERMELLRKPLLDQYKRVFHVLDIGGGVESGQNVGQEVAHTYGGAVVTVFEQDWTKDKFVSSPRTMVCKTALSVVDMMRLSECQHFDVVLALNVVHWYGSQWEAALRTLVGMADWVVVQVPAKGEGDGRADVPGHQYVDDMNDWIEGYTGARGDVRLSCQPRACIVVARILNHQYPYSTFDVLRPE